MTEGAYWRTGARLPVCWVGLQGLGGVPLSDVAQAAASVLAMVLSVFSLYLQRRDRRPRLEIRVRYEYRAAPLDGASPGDTDPPAIHDRSQEGLYLLLGDFLREYGLEYPQGTPLVRFALANKGTQPIYLDSIRLVVVRPREPRGRRLILDPAGTGWCRSSWPAGNRPTSLEPPAAGTPWSLCRRTAWATGSS